jgi:hypothetical protein
MNAESATPTPWAVVCPVHHCVYLTESEYFRQLDRADDAWTCPRVETDPQRLGLCRAPALWDDENYEAAGG